MSVVIVGGNECMIRRYKDLCSEYNCRAKVFIKLCDGLRGKIGAPDLMVLFTSTMSHKMLQCAVCETKGLDTVVARSHSSSLSALRRILDTHAKGEAECLKS